MTKAAVFDLDGVLLDSMGIWNDLGARYLRSLGVTPEEGLNEILFSMSMEQGAEYLHTHYALPQSAAEVGAGIADMLRDFYFYEVPAKDGAAALLGLDRGEVLRVLSMLHAVSGRFEKIRAANGTTAIVDYAHTPDALENVIQTIEEIRTPGQQLIVVCGCGGDRDRTKRPEMAAIAVKYATTAVFTSDNPRHESPEAILDDMVAGLEPGARYLRIADRAEAIRTAVMLSRPGDIILVAGKGHETYQIVGDVKHPFDDREEIKKRFALLN